MGMFDKEPGVLRDFDPAEKLLDIEWSVDEVVKGMRVQNTLLSILITQSMKQAGATEDEIRAMQERIDRLSDGGRLIE